MRLDTKKTSKTPNKVTLDSLIKNAVKMKKKELDRVELYIESLDGTIIIEEPSRDLCMDALDIDDSHEADKYMAYNCVISPNLKDKDLLEAYGCDSPADIVDILFKAGEISKISTEALRLAGYNNSSKVVDEIKN